MGGIALSFGTPAQIGTFATVFALLLIAILKLVIPWRQQNISSGDNAYNRLKEELDELRVRFEECERKCRLQDDIILGMKRQSIAQQISFARIMMRNMHGENPELQRMLTDLESLERDLDPPKFVEGTDELK